MKEKCIVISGVNLVEGGPLSVYKDCLHSLVRWKPSTLNIIALINNIELFDEFSQSGITFLEYPAAKKNWLSRLIFEYYSCINISKKYKPDIWLAMHDLTPNVKAGKRIVYCHNPAPFYPLTLQEAMMEKSLFAFKLFYRFFYGINIKKNDFVIVQQNWIREYFKKWYHVHNVVVAYPQINMAKKSGMPQQADTGNIRFVYPAFPRVFKNFETLFKAAEYLHTLVQNFEVVVTITGNENKYAARLFASFGHLPFIKFIGPQPRNSMWALYDTSSCLVFPSKLETWGLPITEMKIYGKPVLVADCNYAHETVGKYDKVRFFEPLNHIQLAMLMQKIIDGTVVFDNVSFTEPPPYFTKTWEELFSLTLN